LGWASTASSKWRRATSRRPAWYAAMPSSSAPEPRDSDQNHQPPTATTRSASAPNTTIAEESPRDGEVSIGAAAIGS
jgi:hypothetical protein